MALGDVQITIITPCLNGADFVRGAIDSVLRQDNGINIEHIVLDAGSTDDTRNILSEYSSLRIVAEPDKVIDVKQTYAVYVENLRELLRVFLYNIRQS